MTFEQRDSRVIWLAQSSVLSVLSNLVLGLQSEPLLQMSPPPPQTLDAFMFSDIRAKIPTHLIVLDFVNRRIFD